MVKITFAYNSSNPYNVNNSLFLLYELSTVLENIMKKIFAVLLVCIIAISLTACDRPLFMREADILEAAQDILEQQGKMIIDTDEFEEMELALLEPKPTLTHSPAPSAEPTPEPTEEPAFVLKVIPSKTGSALILKSDEYDAYENGKVAVPVADPYYMVLSFDFEFESRNGRVLETKRGIKIGSTVDEVADAYIGIPAKFYDLRVYNNIALDAYIISNPQIYEEDDYAIEYETGFASGNLYTGIEFQSILDFNEIGNRDLLDRSQMYEAEYGLRRLRLFIIFEDNIVTSITIFK